MPEPMYRGNENSVLAELRMDLDVREYRRAGKPPTNLKLKL